VAEKRIQSFRDLDAWQLAMNLAVLVYGAVRNLPGSERFGLSTQIRRAAVSVPSNVAEGQACGEDGRYVHHLRVAIGSLGELSTQVEIAARLSMLPPAIASETEEHVARTGQVLHGLLRYRLQKRRRHLAGSVLLCRAFWFAAFAVLG
jgi:four helix bundle protein